MVVGGSDGAQSLVSTEMFSFVTDSWTLGATLTTQRANLSAVAVNSRLFAIGGFSGKKFLHSIEWLDLDEGEWFGHSLKSLEQHQRVKQACDVVKGACEVVKGACEGVNGACEGVKGACESDKDGLNGVASS